MIYTNIYIKIYMEEERLGQLRHRTPSGVGGGPLWDSLLRQPQNRQRMEGLSRHHSFVLKIVPGPVYL